MKFSTAAVFIISASLPQVLGAIPDVITVGIQNVVRGVHNLHAAVGPLHVQGPFVEKSLVLVS